MSSKAKAAGSSSLLGSGATPSLTLPTDAVRIRKNGIEFRNNEPISAWTEMTVTLQGPNPARKVNFAGVVVDCRGDKTEGYLVSMLFTHVSRLSQARLLGYS